MTSQFLFLVSVIQEGQAVIDLLDLSEDHTVKLPTPMRLFTNQNKHVSLLTMGIGMKAANEAMMYSLKQESFKSCTWINLGIAGHDHHSLGTFFEITKIHSHQSPVYFTLQDSLKTEFPKDQLTTYSEFVKSYPKKYLVDMEAWMIAHHLSHHGLLEHLHVYKMISDNRHQSLLTTPETRQTLGELLREKSTLLLKTLQLH